MIKIFSATNQILLEEKVNLWLKENFPIDVTSMSYTQDQELNYSVALYYKKYVAEW